MIISRIKQVACVASIALCLALSLPAGGQAEIVQREPNVPGAFKDISGDLNVDGKIDASDIQLVINMVLGITTPIIADVNLDGATNASDIQLVINTVLGVKSSGA